MRMVTNHEHKLHLQKKSQKNNINTAIIDYLNSSRKNGTPNLTNGTYYQILMLWRKPKL